jgi:hypothetical protein
LGQHSAAGTPSKVPAKGVNGLVNMELALFALLVTWATILRCLLGYWAPPADGWKRRRLLRLMKSGRKSSCSGFLRSPTAGEGQSGGTRNSTGGSQHRAEWSSQFDGGTHSSASEYLMGKSSPAVCTPPASQPNARQFSAREWSGRAALVAWCAKARPG